MSEPFIALQLNDSYKPVTDGVALCVENYARHLNRGGTPAAVATPWAPNYADDGEFPVFRYPSLPIPGWKPYRAGLPNLAPLFHRRLHQWIDADVTTPVLIHAHSPFSSASLARGLRRRFQARGRKTLLIATLHSKYHADFARVFPAVVVDQIIRLIRRSLATADLVWVPNRGTEQTLRRYGYEGPVTVVNNGADLDPPEDRHYEELRSRGTRLLGVGENDSVFLFVGQQRWEKNLELILRGYARYLSKNADDGTRHSRLVLVGDGPDRKAIAGLARDLGLLRTDPVRARSDGPLILYGQVSDRCVLEAMYARADLFVFPSIYDNAPLVVREAAAFRTPAILARGSAAAGDTIDRRNAFHVDPDPTALASLLTELYASPGTVREVAYAARREVFRSWASIVTEVRERYAEALGE